MGLETAALIGLGGAALGGIGGAITGAQGTPDQRTLLGEKTPEQLALEKESMAQFQAAKNMAGQIEQGIGGMGQLSDAGAQQLMQLLGAQGFGPSASEQALIQQMRNASIGQARTDIEQMLGPQLEQLNSRLAQKGIRGQASSELQGRTLSGAADALQRAIAQADVNAAGQQISMPMQRAQLQSQLAQFSVPLRLQMQQQALQNRMALQNPALLGLEERARMAQPIVPGQEGGFWGGLSGALGGIGAGFGTAASGMEAFGKAKKSGLF